MNRFYVLVLTVLLVGGAYVVLGFTERSVILIDDFESGLGPRWERKDFKGKTQYTVVEMSGNHCLKAESHAAASGLIHKIQYDLKDYPFLTWRWRVENVLDKGDARTREGDDYAARLYVIFPHWIPMLTRSINYIWANKLPQGERTPNPYYSKAMMIAVESGPLKCGRWVSERRDVYEDYRKCFGEAPPQVGAIAIMTDTDNTGESATAYYDDIRIEKGSNLNAP